MTRTLKVPLLFFLLGLVAACQPEPENLDQLVIGRWELDKAFRNGETTNTLQGLYFEFYEDGNMSTNLPVSPSESQYELEGSVIRQTEIETPLEFDIQSISDSNLVLGTQLHNFSFRFLLRKFVPEN